MRLTFTRKAVLAATVTALAVGGGGAYALSQNDDSGREAFLNSAAKRLNVSPDELRDALKGAFFERLDADVAAGRLTQEQADQIKKHVEEEGGVPGLGGPGGGPGGPGHHGPHGGPLMGGIDAAADYLGLSEEKLHAQLRDGKSLADVAKAQGKSVDGLKAAIKKAVASKLDDAVDDGRITKSQRDRMLERLDDRIDHVVDETGPPGPPRGGGGFHGPPPGGFGPPPDQGPPPSQDGGGGSNG